MMDELILLTTASEMKLCFETISKTSKPSLELDLSQPCGIKVLWDVSNKESESISPLTNDSVYSRAASERWQDTCIITLCAPDY